MDLEQIKTDLETISQKGWEVLDSHRHGVKGCRCLSCDEATGYLTENTVFCDEQKPSTPLWGQEECMAKAYTYEDAVFISKAPARIRELVAEVERLRQQLGES